MAADEWFLLVCLLLLLWPVFGFCGGRCWLAGGEKDRGDGVVEFTRAGWAVGCFRGGGVVKDDGEEGFATIASAMISWQTGHDKPGWHKRKRFL